MLAQTFATAGFSVVPVPVADGLHLKSSVTAASDTTLVAADTAAGHAAVDAIRAGCAAAAQPHAVFVPDPLAANVVRCNDHLLISADCPDSEPHLRALAHHLHLQVHAVHNGELAKVDGALTCCSILLELAGPTPASA